MSKKEAPHALKPGTLLMYEQIEKRKVVKREFIIVAKTFIDNRGEVPELAYVGFSSLDGRCTRFATPIFKKLKQARWTILWKPT